MEELWKNASIQVGNVVAISYLMTANKATGDRPNVTYHSTG